MTTHTSMMHVRIDNEIKAKATVTLNAMGLSVSEAVRLFLCRIIADETFPFDLKVPNKKTRAAMAEAENIAHNHNARFATSDELFTNLEKNNSK
ncbi:type II toxin-antitoxin system RelB/DinJ family antitoxin [Candidatus Regiella endosymbiont of Tuberolachnus salignus]|uniref:type II toxin-antitoxin system RelB/DinJ family antitoxin n=1 Tax=Candidatus Regiella endosymbiont of Tuberolachnus salignus TaxID=3077956 RepID=UPI0030D1E0F5